MFGLKRPMTEIEAIDRELERLHDIFGESSKEGNTAIWRKIVELTDLLTTITKKNNGMDW